MLERSEATELVLNALKDRAPWNDQWALLVNKTIEETFGWIFFYNTKKFVETGETIFRLAGNGPIIVNRYTGSIDFFGSTPSLAEIIAEYIKDQSV